MCTTSIMQFSRPIKIRKKQQKLVCAHVHIHTCKCTLAQSYMLTWLEFYYNIYMSKTLHFSHFEKHLYKCMQQSLWADCAAPLASPPSPPPPPPPPPPPQRDAVDVWCFPPVWNLRAVIWFPFPISSHFFCLALLVFLSFCLVIFLLVVRSSDFFPENSNIFY